MKAQISLELFGENIRSLMKAHSGIANFIIPGLGDVTFGESQPPSSWCAEIVGPCERYKFKRIFLKAKKDYSKANSKGSRGVFAIYILESGKYYDIKEKVSNRRSVRYFAKVDYMSGDVLRVEEREVLEWLKNQ